MIGLVKTAFHLVKEMHTGSIYPYIPKGETILKQFKNFDMDCFFTSRHMVFIHTNKMYNDFVEDTEIEYIPYRSVDHFTYTGSDKVSTYNLEVTFRNSISIMFTSYTKVDAIILREFLNEHI